MGLPYSILVRPMLRFIDSENAHSVSMKALSTFGQSRVGQRALSTLYNSPELPIHVFGRLFHHPLGLAAGFDKGAKALSAWPALGFSWIEYGGITRFPQDGNPKPRMFRASKDKALINRMGFNNIGAHALQEKLQYWKDKGLWPDSPVGINLGKSKITPLKDAPLDYSGSIKILWKHADFFVINVSSPNTPGLRNLQESKNLESVIVKCCEINKECSEGDGDAKKPLLVKIAPELDDGFLEDIVKLVKKHKLSGIVATNTTIDRPETANTSSEKIYKEAGGLSGAPLKDKSTETIRKIYRLTKGKIPTIGVGGIFTAEDAWNKITAGASIVQLYTGLVFEGPGIAKSIVKGLKKRVEREGFESISDAVGIEA